ncbi:MAG: gltX [Cyanobacteria bacterium RYN_339]|nr:gltX [Cyanobacteria bacterium RYN_339]
MVSEVRGRYAPSPTGELHLGNARTALAAWLGTRAANGTFVMRVEDLDPPRVIPGAEARLLDDLAWLGIDWDEGPYRQSERLPLFAEALDRLEGRVFGCKCTRAELKQLASAPHGVDGPVYPGTCREGGLPALGCALRFRVAPGEVCFDDLVAGSVCQDVAGQVGDFVVRRADGLFAYQLAVVVDDALMGINQVVRGHDLLDSTARQIQLQEALGFPRPAYAHVPLVLDAEGNRLAKRDRATAIRDLREAGVPAERLIGLLGWSLGLLPAPTPVAARELVAAFAWNRLETSPWRCGATDLSWLMAR